MTKRGEAFGKSAASTNEIESSSSTLKLTIRTPLAGKRYPSLNRDSQKDIKATGRQLGSEQASWTATLNTVQKKIYKI